MPFVFGHIRQEIEGNRKPRIRGIEIHQMIRPGAGNVIQKLLRQIPMGVNHANAMSKGDVLDNHVPKQGALARTRFSNDIQVMPQIGRADAKTG